MVVLLSPAKSLNFDDIYSGEHTQPLFPSETAVLTRNLKEKSAGDIKELMSISDKLANLNYDRYQSFGTGPNYNTAIHAFTGDVYQGFQVKDMTKTELKRAQKQVRILSGLYGYIRPLDLIQPYRLEMGTKLKLETTRNLYEFWGDKITHEINNDLATHKDKSIINVASNEYFKAVKSEKLDGQLYTITFKEMRDGKLKFVSFSAKKARGMMARYIVKENIKKANDIVGFNLDRYKFEPSLSSEFSFTFIR